MRWCKEKPTEPGYYWYKVPNMQDPIIVEVWRDFDDELMVHQEGFDDADITEMPNYQWSDKPIPKPE